MPHFHSLRSSILKTLMRTLSWLTSRTLIGTFCWFSRCNCDLINTRNSVNSTQPKSSAVPFHLFENVVYYVHRFHSDFCIVNLYFFQFRLARKIFKFPAKTFHWIQKVFSIYSSWILPVDNILRVCDLWLRRRNRSHSHTVLKYPCIAF